jgi:hypothetical protein
LPKRLGNLGRFAQKVTQKDKNVFKNTSEEITQQKNKS